MIKDLLLCNALYNRNKYERKDILRGYQLLTNKQYLSRTEWGIVILALDLIDVKEGFEDDD